MTQQDKALVEEDALLGTDTQDAFESVKYYLWRGDVEAALERFERLSFDSEINRRRSETVANLS